VERELLRLGGRAEFAQLAEHLADDSETVRSEGKWPKATANLPDLLKIEFTNIHGLKRTIDEHDKAHAGEIATVLMAQH
jgi:hypothetical protein